MTGCWVYYRSFFSYVIALDGMEGGTFRLNTMHIKTEKICRENSGNEYKS